MPAYSDQTDIRAPADAVFRYVADVKNLSKYLPTVHHAEPEAGERVKVEGVANHHEYTSDGWFKTDAASKTVTWGSDGENDYSGKMSVSGDGASSRIAITINFSPKPEIARSMDENQGGPGAAMQDGIRTALANIARQCEGDDAKQLSTAER